VGEGHVGRVHDGREAAGGSMGPPRESHLSGHKMLHAPLDLRAQST